MIHDKLLQALVEKQTKLFNDPGASEMDKIVVYQQIVDYQKIRKGEGR